MLLMTFQTQVLLNQKLTGTSSLMSSIRLAHLKQTCNVLPNFWFLNLYYFSLLCFTNSLVCVLVGFLYVLNAVYHIYRHIRSTSRCRMFVWLPPAWIPALPVTRTQRMSWSWPGRTAVLREHGSYRAPPGNWSDIKN